MDVDVLLDVCGFTLVANVGVYVWLNSTEDEDDVCGCSSGLLEETVVAAGYVGSVGALLLLCVCSGELDDTTLEGVYAAAVELDDSAWVDLVCVYTAAELEETACVGLLCVYTAELEECAGGMPCVYDAVGVWVTALSVEIAAVVVELYPILELWGLGGSVCVCVMVSVELTVCVSVR